MFIGDYILSTHIPSFNEGFETGQKCVETFALSELHSVVDAVSMLKTQLGMDGIPSINGARSKVELGGVLVGGVKVYARIEMVLSPSEGITMQVSVSSADVGISEMIANFIQ